jgi:hypothetical protein
VQINGNVNILIIKQAHYRKGDFLRQPTFLASGVGTVDIALLKSRISCRALRRCKPLRVGNALMFALNQTAPCGNTGIVKPGNNKNTPLFHTGHFHKNLSRMNARNFRPVRTGYKQHAGAGFT